MCEAHINETIRRNFDVKKVVSSHRKNTTEIVSAESLDRERLTDVIAKTGYTLAEIAEHPYEKRAFYFSQR